MLKQLSSGFVGVKFVVLMIAAMLLVSCSPSEEKEISKLIEFKETEMVIAEPGQLVVSFEPSTDIEELKKAWAIFEAEIELLGPKENGLLIVSFPAHFDMEKVTANIAATVGIKEVQANFIREPMHQQDVELSDLPHSDVKNSN